MTPGEPVGATVRGVNYGAFAPSAGAQADLLTVYAAMISHLSSATAIASALDGVTLTPGVYMCTTYCTLDGTLTLDGQGDTNGVFQFITEGCVEWPQWMSVHA